MKIKLLFILLFVVGSASFVCAQSVMKFQEVKDVGDSKTVYFQIKGLGDDDAERQQLLDVLIEDANIIKGRIFTSGSFRTRCQLFLTHNITPGYIRSILQSYGYDFEFSSVTMDGKFLEQRDKQSFASMFYSPVKGFPVIAISGDKKDNSLNYQLEKETWIENNHRKYDKSKSKGTAEYPIIISQEQFDSFTEAKQEKILLQPDVFEIK